MLGVTKTYVTEITHLINELKRLGTREHYSCVDCWYSCPMAVGEYACCDEANMKNPTCTCGAKIHNKQVEDLVSSLMEKLGYE